MDFLGKVTNNLGEESIGKLILKLSLPALISQLVNLIYNMVDKMYIGHIEGEGLYALTGLGLCLPIMIVISASSCLFGMGGAPKAAIEMGKGNNEEAEKILGNVVTAIFVTALILTVTLSIFGKDLLILLGASSETVVYAWDYLRIYVLGTIFVQITLGLNMFIMTQGFAKYSMITVIGSAVINIIIYPIFIFVLGLGIRGAAIATILSQAVSSIWILYFLHSKKSKLKIKRKNLKLSSKIILSVMALGAAPFVMQSTESILNICFNSSLQKYGGDVAVGTMTIVYSVFQLTIMVIQGFAQGTQPIISYNYGAGKMHRVKKAVNILVCICTSFTTLVCLSAEFFPETIVSIFNNDPALISTASWAIKIYIFGFAI